MAHACLTLPLPDDWTPPDELPALNVHNVVNTQGSNGFLVASALTCKTAVSSTRTPFFNVLRLLTATTSYFERHGSLNAGASSSARALLTAHRCNWMLSEADNVPLHVTAFEECNRVQTASVGVPLNLDLIYRTFPLLTGFSSKTPFPGCIFRPVSPDDADVHPTFLLFDTGSVVIMGACDETMIWRQWYRVWRMLATLHPALKIEASSADDGVAASGAAVGGAGGDLPMGAHVHAVTAYDIFHDASRLMDGAYDEF